MFDLTVMEWIIIIFSALLIGFAKAGVASMGILVVTIFMMLFPARESIGILLPLLIVGDLFAVIYYRRNVVWRYLFSLVPWVLIGILIGYVVLFFISSEQLKPLIGILVLALIVLHISREKMGERFVEMLPKSKLFTFLMGITAGFATMIGNAAGGVMAIYLIVKGLPKKEFVGTGAWFFLFVNLVKMPFYLSLGIVTWETIAFNSKLVPAIIIGALIGVKVIKIMPQKVFQVLVLVFAALGAIRLIMG
ncbi:sulfite exporter TauE/SafE family protein [Gracilibacillus caseinilyticus]|uniref:Probable membrane transporter protein n=1 Tax=Gracilibacillus caseinilyticus TaxID=2932256 RepID=A0ABY4ES70_9BACI|nr:sulfite exporter TauE/SafE family protein [Gracilibacillus caseinilyticus]UOQ47074.1 sulfite exporter TauE/SafE family protein [Gracilibacillus caseinilyticus]